MVFIIVEIVAFKPRHYCLAKVVKLHQFWWTKWISTTFMSFTLLADLFLKYDWRSLVEFQLNLVLKKKGDNDNNNNDINWPMVSKCLSILKCALYKVTLSSNYKMRWNITMNSYKKWLDIHETRNMSDKNRRFGASFSGPLSRLHN